MLSGRNLFTKWLSFLRRWCVFGNRALLLGNVLLLIMLYMAHFQKELARREVLEAAVQDLQRELASTRSSLQETRSQVQLQGEKAVRLQAAQQLCEQRRQISAKELDELRVVEEDGRKKLQVCNEDMDMSLAALNASREQQALVAEAVRCCESVPMCNLCRMRR
ncbi:unnamed protein product [Effrenium voratum]|uniref:Uncharacterized protein n=1 Tax=Effrenium voratum TaxID=2562239 RepID=A0AA36NMC3_9DINO|nr:unnamed protein product [Effrenium voratum]